MSTIFALASARGKAGVSVIRISGPLAVRALEEFSRSVKPRRASLRTLSFNGLLLDEAIVLLFAAPESFTGEDVVELHLHGSRATVGAVLSALSEVPGLRPADPGEFTRRALENERLDLAQVEGLSDLIEAETEAQRRQALRVLSGAIGDRAEEWRKKLIRAAALLEATIDFVDEDVPVDVQPEVEALLTGVQAGLAKELAGARAAERVRDGFEVAIVGPPNAGKSTLLNALAGREAAITSEFAGTTRDVIEVRMDLDGLAVTLLDTAGIREASDAVEAVGVSRARDRAKQADLRVILKTNSDLVVQPEDGDLVLRPKSDLGHGDFSARTGNGLDTLIERITRELSKRAASAGLAVRERHRIAMTECNNALEEAISRLRASTFQTELVAEDIREGINALDSLVGRVGVEDLLDDIFANFCIGK